MHDKYKYGIGPAGRWIIFSGASGLVRTVFGT